MVSSNNNGTSKILYLIIGGLFIIVCSLAGLAYSSMVDSIGKLHTDVNEIKSDIKVSHIMDSVLVHKINNLEDDIEEIKNGQ